MTSEEIERIVAAELLPCPFCGGAADGNVQGPYPPEIVQIARVGCKNCRIDMAATGRESEPWPRLVAAWNRRALLARPADELERIRAVINPLIKHGTHLRWCRQAVGI